MNCGLNCLKGNSRSLQKNTNPEEYVQPHLTDNGTVLEPLERDRELQNKKASNIPPMSVKYGQVLYTSSYGIGIEAEEEVQQHLDSLSSEEREAIHKVMERDTKLQNEIAKNIPQIPVKSSLIVQIFNWSLEDFYKINKPIRYTTLQYTTI